MPTIDIDQYRRPHPGCRFAASNARRIDCIFCAANKITRWNVGEIGMMRCTLFGLAALASLAAAVPAFAGSIQEPGETTGVALGPPLPEGFYFVNFLNYGTHASDPNLSTTVEIPIGLWSTPWTFLGGRILLGFSAPSVNVAVTNGIGRFDWYYPETIYGLGWTLSPNLSASIIGATYYPVKTDITQLIIGDRGTNRFGGAMTYSLDGWSFSAYTQYGIPYGSDSSVPGGGHQWVNLDLTALKAVGPWQFGLVGYGSADTTSPYGGYRRQNDVALGPLLGYDFGPLTLQVKVTTEINEANYGGKDTRVWTNLILPLKF